MREWKYDHSVSQRQWLIPMTGWVSQNKGIGCLELGMRIRMRVTYDGMSEPEQGPRLVRVRDENEDGGYL